MLSPSVPQVYTYDWLLSVSEEVEIVSARGGLTWTLAIYFVARCVMPTCARCYLLIRLQRERAHTLAPPCPPQRCVCTCACVLRRAEHPCRGAAGHLPARVRHTQNSDRPINRLLLIAIPPPDPRCVHGVSANNRIFWAAVAGHRGGRYSDQCEYTHRFVPCVYSMPCSDRPSSSASSRYSDLRRQKPHQIHVTALRNILQRYDGLPGHHLSPDGRRGGGA